MDTYALIAYLVATIIFALAALNVASARVSLVALGLAVWVSVSLVQSIKTY